MPLPNILWVCTEHQRFDTVHALGNPHIRTPNLDRLVTEGTAFTHAFCQNPVCTPSRSSFLTGRYPSTTRCRQNGQDIPCHEILITGMLADLGYDCGLAGKLHVSAAFTGSERRIDDGYRMFEWSHGSTEKHGGRWVRWLGEQGKGFDEVYLKSPTIFSREVTERRYHQTTWCFDKALEFARQNRNEPWLVSINPFAAHDPFDYLPEFLQHYDPAEMPGPDFEPGELENKPFAQQAAYAHRPRRGGFEATTDLQRRQMQAAYFATIEHIDAEFGRMLDWLDDSGQRENTLIIFNSDHGDMGGDHGIFQKGPYLYDPAVRIPLIISGPGNLSCGLQCDALVELVDLAPTILELLGQPVPERMQGKSLVPILREQQSPELHRDSVFAEYYNSNPPAHSPQQRPVYATMFRTHQHKLVVYHGEETGELYDLAEDPGEFKNLWDAADHRDLKLDLMKRCFDRSVFCMDPIPARPVGF